MATSARGSNSLHQYTPELAAILQTFGGMQTCLETGLDSNLHKDRLGRESSSLIRLVYRDLLGSVTTAEALVLYWLQTIPHPSKINSKLSSSSSSSSSVMPKGSVEHEALADMLYALVSAPAAPCVRVHRVGGDEAYRVVFHPFGVGRGGTSTSSITPLAVPLQHTDPRVVRALQHLIGNPWAFRHIDEDPTFGYFTLSCFAYACEAQEELDACRPVLVCAALRAMTLCIRRETGRTHQHHQPKQLHHQRQQRCHPLGISMAATLHYTRAATEEGIRAKVERTILHPMRWKGRGEKIAEQELLRTAFQFVYRERTAASQPHPRSRGVYQQMARAGMDLSPAARALPATIHDPGIQHDPSGGVRYPVLPSYGEIYRFSDQVMSEWLRILALNRAHRLARV